MQFSGALYMSDDDDEQCRSVASLMLGAGLPLLQLQWLQLCTYKIQIHVQVQVLIHLLSCFFSRISVALVAGVVLLSALSSIAVPF